MTTQKKLTLASFKSFVKKNRENLQIRVTSKFDGMTDCVERCDDNKFSPAMTDQYVHENNMGIQGIWLVFGSRDRFYHYEQDGMIGIHCYNCCGSFTVAIKA